LKDKLGSLGAEREPGVFKEEEEALEALRSLGYSLNESRTALRDLPENVRGTENIVKEALKNVNKPC
jgi:Holliday junction resolvasome RuvABC DNA-binding subunit